MPYHLISKCIDWTGHEEVTAFCTITISWILLNNVTSTAKPPTLVLTVWGQIYVTLALLNVRVTVLQYLFWCPLKAMIWLMLHLLWKHCKAEHDILNSIHIIRHANASRHVHDLLLYHHCTWKVVRCYRGETKTMELMQAKSGQTNIYVTLAIKLFESQCMRNCCSYSPGGKWVNRKDGETQHQTAFYVCKQVIYKAYVI